MTYEQLNASGSVIDVQDVGATGQWLDCDDISDGDICFEGCAGLPFVETAAPFGAESWRIQVPATAGTVLKVSVDEDDDIIR